MLVVLGVDSVSSPGAETAPTSDCTPSGGPLRFLLFPSTTLFRSHTWMVPSYEPLTMLVVVVVDAVSSPGAATAATTERTPSVWPLRMDADVSPVKCPLNTWMVAAY